jgi:dolichol-phosphate mannosyltransferase
MRISVVIPAFNEEGNIGRLIAETFAQVPESALGEVIVIDDASDDGTGAEIKGLLGQYPHLRYLRHGQRAGQSAALRTGVLAARYAVIATMDGDGQNDPADIPRLLDALARDPGGELRLVCGWRRRREDAWNRRVASRVANAARRAVLRDGTPDAGCGLRLVHRATFLELPFFDHLHRFLPALVAAAGGRVASVEVGHRPRTRGRSKYGLGRRLAAGLVDLLGVLWLRRRLERVELDEIGPADQSVSRPTGERP